MKQPTASVLVLSAALLLTACGQRSAEDLLADARTALAANDAKTAQVHLKNALQQNGGLAEARYLLGRVLLEGGDVRGASVEFDKAAEAGHPADQLAPLQAEALLRQRLSRKLIERFGKTELAQPAAQAQLLLQLGRAHMALGEPQEAKPRFLRARELAPQQAAAAIELARLTAIEGQADAALQALDSLLQQHPKEADAWQLKGDIHARRFAEIAAQGPLDEARSKRQQAEAVAARQAFEQAVAVAPARAEPRLSLLGWLLGQRDMAEAKKQLADAKTRVGAKTPGLRFYGAVIDMEEGRLDAAAAEVEQLLKLSPDDPRLLLLAGQVELMRERFLQAESHLVRAVGLQAQPLRARMLLAQTYLRLADPARAVQTLQPLLEEGVRGVSPQALARLHATAGEALLQLGESRKAEAQFRRASELDPKDSRSRTLLALGKVAGGAGSAGEAELRDIAADFDDPMGDLALISTLLRKGDHAAAMKAVDGIERKMAGKAGMVAVLRARVHAAQGKEAEARAALQAGLKAEPGSLPAALQLARLDLLAGKPAEARGHVEGVVKADATNSAARLALVQVRQQGGEAPAQLVEPLAELVKQQPQLPRARVALARMQMQAGDMGAAARSVQDGVAALPNEAELVELQLELQLRQGDTTLAKKTIDRLIELRPAAPEPLLRRAELEQRGGQTREALVSVRKALALRPSHGPALLKQIELEGRLGNTAAARRFAKELQQLPGQEGLGALAEGDLDMSQGKPDDAAGAYRRALARNAALPDAPAKLHRALRMAGKSADADALARDWFKDHGRDIAFANYLGDAALDAGQWETAKQRYQQSLAVQPRQPLVLNNLAWVLLRLNDSAGAEKSLQAGLQLAPTEAALHDTQAELLAIQGKHDAAQAAQRRALALDASPVFRVGLAKRLIAAGKKDEARTELSAVQRLGTAYAGQPEVTALLAQLGA